MEDNRINRRKFKVVFSVDVDVDIAEIDKMRNTNRGLMTNGFFAKDETVAMVIAFNKAREAVLKQLSEVKYEVIPISDANINLSKEK